VLHFTKGNHRVDFVLGTTMLNNAQSYVKNLTLSGPLADTVVSGRRLNGPLTDTVVQTDALYFLSNRSSLYNMI
jgi:hypothetical protein